MAMFGSDAASGSFPPPALSDTAEQRFNSFSVFAAFPVALVFGGIAESLVSSGQIPIGIVFAAVAIGSALIGLRIPYVAIARPDRSLTFKSLTRTISTNLSHVERITRQSGGRGGSSWVFYFDGTRAQLNNRSGRILAGYVVDRNPHVEYPPSLDRHRLPTYNAGGTPVSLIDRPRSVRARWSRLHPLIRVALGILAFFVVLDFIVHGNLTLSTPSMPVTTSGSSSVATVTGVSCVSQGPRSGYLTAAGTITPKETLPLGLVVNATITDASGQQFGFGQAMISHVEAGQSQGFTVSINPGDRPPTSPAHGCFVTWLAVAANH